MQILTPSGYKSAASLAIGDEVCAFDLVTGAPIVNTIENIELVDYAEWRRWWSIEASVPAFTWQRINDQFLLFREQSIWRNGTNVCHARDLVVGDVIYDDADQPVTIAAIEEVVDDSLAWYRFDISGDHSYIVDGLTVHNASRFWVGGTGTWDLSATTHWASSTGGTSGSSAPGSADAAIFDANSGGGTVTPNFSGTGTFQAFQWGAFTGTIDFNTNNNSVTLNGTGTTAFNGSGGTAARTMRLGNGTWSLTGTVDNGQTYWLIPNSTNLTFSANSSTISFTGNAASGSGGGRVFQSVGLTYNNISFTGTGAYTFVSVSGNHTFNSFTIGPKARVAIGSGMTINATTISTTSTSSAQCSLGSASPDAQATISITSGTQTLSWSAISDIVFTGGATFSATSSFDLGNNSGITITAPSGGGGGVGVIGS